MTNEDKARAIRAWIDPQERVTVDFADAQGLNAEVTGCSQELVDLALETTLLHFRQNLSLPLGQVQVSEDPMHYTRDPDRPARQGRLRLSIDMDRPTVIY